MAQNTPPEWMKKLQHHNPEFADMYPMFRTQTGKYNDVRGLPILFL
jgi:hypothetical protein